jgi:hypothetical protein
MGSDDPYHHEQQETNDTTPAGGKTTDDYATHSQSGEDEEARFSLEPMRPVTRLKHPRLGRPCPVFDKVRRKNIKNVIMVFYEFCFVLLFSV